jgi:hypothetical protein
MRSEIDILVYGERRESVECVQREAAIHTLGEHVAFGTAIVARGDESVTPLS